jgi:hypothetical protein
MASWPIQVKNGRRNGSRKDLMIEDDKKLELYGTLLAPLPNEYRALIISRQSVIVL